MLWSAVRWLFYIFSFQAHPDFSDYACKSVANCGLVAGYQAVYRVCFALTSFFFLLCIIMINVKSSKDFRASIQNG